MSPLTVAIRANGGEVIGLGHIRRCLTLAEALARQGATVHFITNDNQAALDTVRTIGFDATPVNLEKDFEQTRDAVGRLQANVLVVDSYDIDADYLTRIRDPRNILVAIDDNADRPLPVDVVINGAAYAPDLSYDALANTVLLLGADYVILRKEFASPPVRKIEGPARKVLVTIGGSDPTALTPRLIDWLLGENTEIQLDVVVGPFFEVIKPIAEAAAQTPDQVRVHYNPSDMRSLMLEADLAITGGGQTTYELAATGTPALAILTAQNQLQNLQALDRLGTLIFAGSLDDADLIERLSNGFATLVNDTERRSRMSRRGRELVDGQGAERLAQALAEQAAKAASLSS